MEFNGFIELIELERLRAKGKGMFMVSDVRFRVSGKKLKENRTEYGKRTED